MASTTTNCSACQVVMDRRMILVLPGRRQQFICFSSREKIYYLFFIFIRKHKILLHERKKTKSQRNRNIGGGPRKETKLRKTEKGEQMKKRSRNRNIESGIRKGEKSHQTRTQIVGKKLRRRWTRKENRDARNNSAQHRQWDGYGNNRNVGPGHCCKSVVRSNQTDRRRIDDEIASPRAAAAAT